MSTVGARSTPRERRESAPEVTGAVEEAAPPEEAVERREPGRRVTSPRTVLAVASLGVFMAFVDATIVNVAFPSIERSFPSVGFSDLSWVLNAYNIVFAALLVWTGRMADLIGRRRTFAAGIVLFTLASIACAAAPTPAFLVGARVIQAIGAAILVPCSLGLVLHAFPDYRRAHAVALWTAVAALAAGVGPSLGGILVSASGWRAAFLVNVPVGLVALIVARRTLVENREPGHRRLPDLVGAVMLAASLGSLTFGVTKTPDWGWTDPRVLSALAISALLLVLFLERCRRQPVPLVDLGLLRVRTFAVANATTLVGAAGYFAYTLGNILFLTSVWRYSVLQAGLAISPGPFVAVAVARPTSNLADRIGHRWVVCAGAAVWAAGLGWFLARVGSQPAYLSEWLPGTVLLGVGAGAAFPNLSAVAVASAPGERFATATAINSVARQFGAVLGVALLVAIVGAPGPAQAQAAFHHAWTFAAICFGIVAVGALAITPVRAPRREADAPTPPDPSPLRSLVQQQEPSTALSPRPARPPSSATPGEFLRAAPMFAELTDELRDRIAAGATRERVRAGSWLFHQGDPGHCLYLLRSGRLEVVKEDPGFEPEVILTLERGSVIGELAVLTDSPRAASVRAVRDSELLRLERHDFQALLRQAPELSLALNRTLAAQVQSSRAVPQARRPLPVTIAIVPLQPDLQMPELAVALGAALAAFGDTAGLDAGIVGDAGEDPIGAFAPIVDRCEVDSDRVLLAAGSPWEPDPWTEFALARADRIVALTRGGPPPGWLTQCHSLHGCELAGYDVSRGSGALSGWIEALRPTVVHALHSGPGLGPSTRMLARRLAGVSTGIVLSGGGARALSHLGVLEELTRAGIHIDRIGGVSMGAFIGAQLALGRPLEAIDACCYEEWVRRNPINDYTLPRAALIRGRKAEAMVERVFGDVAIEELDRSFYCASADLRSGELVVHRHGRIAEQVGASLCLPILAPPRCHDGRMLIDGSLLDNLPVAPMAGTGEGPVIAVDVKPSRGSGESRRDGDRHRHGDPRPILSETFARFMQLATTNTHEAARRHADFTLRVPVSGVGLLEFHQIDAAREAGRRAAHEALADAPAELFL